MRHPAAGMGTASGGSFVPNDIQLGGEAPGFIVLTGPNMGGKSTLLRQVCLHTKPSLSPLCLCHPVVASVSCHLSQPKHGASQEVFANA